MLIALRYGLPHSRFGSEVLQQKTTLSIADTLKKCLRKVGKLLSQNLAWVSEPYGQ